MKGKAAMMAALLWGAMAGLMSADEAGNAIAARADALDVESPGRSRYEMTVYPAGGGERRVFVIEGFERGNGDSLASFSEPRTIRGLRILSAGKDSWVFFPSTGRVRKIAGSSRSGSVQGVGGDFSYDDLGAGSWSRDYDFDLKAETAEAWEIEGRARSADAAYDSVRLSVAKATGRPLKAAFSSAKEGGYWKELTFSDYRDFSGRTRASSMEMRNLRTGSRTTVRILDAEYGKKPEDRLFDPARFDK